MKRLFHPGEEWLYFRVYTGPETAEACLVDVLAILVEELKQKGLIKSFFFLRYLDPLLHLRIRFLLTDIKHFGYVINRFRELSDDYLKDELIWKFEIGSYDRELERYGEDWIERAEEVFGFDSDFWLGILPGLREDDSGETKRWHIALLSAHWIFNDFNLAVGDRINLLTKMIDTLFSEFGGGKKLRLQIDDKFRKSRRYLERIMQDASFIDFQGFSEVLIHRSDSVCKLLSSNTDFPDWSSELKKQRISDIIHMSLNRGLRSKQRMQELLIYSFLKQLYASSEAREK